MTCWSQVVFVDEPLFKLYSAENDKIGIKFDSLYHVVAQFLANVNSRSRSLYAIARPSVVCLSSVTFVRPTHAVEIFGNISTALGTLAIR